MAGLRTASTWIKVALVTIILAIILFVIGFATTAWVVATWYRNDPRLRQFSYWSYGLWQQRICHRKNYRLGDGCYDVSNAGQHDWFHAGQAMECLGLIFLIIAFIVMILYICATSFRRRNPLLLTILTTFLSVVCIVIGLAIFISKFNEMYFELSWSMGLAIAAAICAFISGIMSLLELCSK